MIPYRTVGIQGSMSNHIMNSEQNNVLTPHGGEPKTGFEMWQDYKQCIYDTAKGNFNETAQSYQDSKMSEAERIQEQNYLYALALAEQQQKASQSSADKRMQFEDEQALRARKWQLEDRNSSYQVAVDDMKKAGLNPAVMFNNGANSAFATSAIAGSGAQGSMTAGTPDNSTLATILQESMSNQSAMTTALMNNLGRILEKLIPSQSIITRAK